MTPAERLDAAGRWLASVGGAASPGELGAALDLNGARQADTVRALREGGFVNGPKGQIRLTPAGWAQYGVTQQSSFGDVLGAALEGWPHAHRAFVGLLASTMVARHHLAAERPSRWLGFMAIGETGSGKSAAVELTADLFGLDLVGVRVFLSSETAGTLLGRREQDADGWRFTPAPLTRGPLAFFDEFDKGDDAQRRAALPYFQAEARTMAEGEQLVLAPVPVLAANQPARGDRYALLRPEYRRRSVVLDTQRLRGRGELFEDLMSRRPRDGARLSLDRLKPPVSRLDQDALDVLRQVRHALTERGLEEFPGVEALELAALGRLALLGNGDQISAAIGTALDYLMVTETVPDQVIDGWQPGMDVLRAHAGLGGASLADVFQQSRAEQDQARGEVRRARVNREAEDLVLVQDRHQLAERLRLAAEALDGRRITAPLRAEAAGVRAALRTLRSQVLDSRSRVRLDDCTAMAGGPLGQAESLVARADAERQRAEAERQQAAADREYAKRAEAQQRQAARDQQRAWRERWSGELQQVVEEAKSLEQLYERRAVRQGESPFALLRDYRVGGEHALLEYVPPPKRDKPQGFFATVGRALEGPQYGTWRVTGQPGLALPGTAISCPSLAEWGPHTRAVLAPVLRELHAYEDQLRQNLGRRGRQRPAIVDGPVPAPVLAGPRQPRAALTAR